MNRKSTALLVGAAICTIPALAAAHISVASGPAFANTTQEVTLGVGHGCSGSDTYSVRVEIPAGVTSVRAETSDFGKATVEKDGALNVIAVTWQKPLADALDSDTNYYKLTLRLKVPDAPFTTINFPAHQTCRAADGTLTVVDWVAAVESATEEPAPALKILPVRRGGWNKYTVPAAVPDLDVYFSDAVIVWKGTAGYSASADTAELIKNTTGVEELTSLAAGDVIWVKY